MKKIVDFVVYYIKKTEYFLVSFTGDHSAPPSKFSVSKGILVVYCFQVFFPCFLVSNAIAGEGPELFDCRSVAKDFVVKVYPEIVLPESTGKVDFRLCWSEGGAELGAGDNKFLILHDGDSRSIGRFVLRWL